jgi:ribosome-associated protein
MQNTVREGISSEQMSDLVVQGMLEKKALDISVLDLREIKHAVADFFIICSGNSDTQIDAISESVQQTVKKATGQFPWKKEGFQNKEWILVDYVDVVVHIFTTERRAFYGLEELWADAKINSIKE